MCVHFLLGSVFSGNLPLEEISVILVDFAHSRLEALLLLVVVSLVEGPHRRLLVDVGLIVVLSCFLLLNLSVKE